MFFTPGSPQYTETFWMSFLLYVGAMTFLTIVMTMLYNQTRGSVLVCMLLHASLNAAAFSMQVPSGAIPIILVIEVAALAVAIPLLPRPLFGRGIQDEE